jgi:hypothetical protein
LRAAAAVLGAAAAVLGAAAAVLGAAAAAAGAAAAGAAAGAAAPKSEDIKPGPSLAFFALLRSLSLALRLRWLRAAVFVFVLASGFFVVNKPPKIPVLAALVAGAVFAAALTDISNLPCDNILQTKAVH